MTTVTPDEALAGDSQARGASPGRRPEAPRKRGRELALRSGGTWGLDFPRAPVHDGKSGFPFLPVDDLAPGRRVGLSKEHTFPPWLQEAGPPGQSAFANPLLLAPTSLLPDRPSLGGSVWQATCIFSCLPGQYPTQPTYPVQPPGNPVYPQTLHLPQAPPYTDAPPAYSEVRPACWT